MKYYTHHATWIHTAHTDYYYNNETHNELVKIVNLEITSLKVWAAVSCPKCIDVCRPERVFHKPLIVVGSIPGLISQSIVAEHRQLFGSYNALTKLGCVCLIASTLTANTLGWYPIHSLVWSASSHPKRNRPALAQDSTPVPDTRYMQLTKTTMLHC